MDPPFHGRRGPGAEGLGQAFPDILPRQTDAAKDNPVSFAVNGSSQAMLAGDKSPLSRRQVQGRCIRPRRCRAGGRTGAAIDRPRRVRVDAQATLTSSTAKVRS
ncbi:hypothetical protein MACH21_11930 [Roseicyclus marinus]|uniref:Uncharacterized protein n=1 Tax=Roseicyclus marinus TaxID=2161673 RepID=A0AA48HS27_9RHOB|nr:hypothetical protein MACH21_11930 [Roseicyclus marinus]